MTALPILDSAYRLTGAQIDAFRNDGFVHLPGLCSQDEVAAWRNEIRQTCAVDNHESRPLHQRDTYGKVFLQTLHLQLIAPVLAGFVTAPRFGG